MNRAYLSAGRAQVSKREGLLRESRVPLKRCRASLKKSQAPLKKNQAPLKTNQALLKKNQAPLKENQADLEKSRVTLGKNQALLKTSHAPLDTYRLCPKCIETGTKSHHGSSRSPAMSCKTGVEVVSTPLQCIATSINSARNANRGHL